MKKLRPETLDACEHFLPGSKSPDVLSLLLRTKMKVHRWSGGTAGRLAPLAFVWLSAMFLTLGIWQRLNTSRDP